jgi:hypothetical protein
MIEKNLSLSIALYRHQAKVFDGGLTRALPQHGTIGREGEPSVSGQNWQKLTSIHSTQMTPETLQLRIPRFDPGLP